MSSYDTAEAPTVRLTNAGPRAGRAADAEGGQWDVGSWIDNRYRVLDVRGGPGRSGMGVVYIIEDKHGRFAAKTFQGQFATNLPLIQRFMREARAWMLIGAHPNIVQAHRLDIIEAVPYLFMEYVESDDTGAVTLADRLNRGPLEIVQATRFAIQCCDGMLHASAAVPGLVHRDLKPENLLIARDGTLKITDFGLVRCHINACVAGKEEAVENAKDGNLTHVGIAMGTPAYMAPEQFTEAGAVTFLADQYAFGCCFYEALTGGRLFTIFGSTPIEHLARARRMHLTEPPVPLCERLPDCPEDLGHIIMRCLAKSPAERWSGFEEVRERLKHVLRRHFGEEYAPQPMIEISSDAVAAQMRSLTLLDGYSRAVTMRHLRESRSQSPYAFHLALASYFHCHGEPDEERRQLEKATRVRGAEKGHEAVRRLSERLVESGELDEAERLLGEFLGKHPDDLDSVLEPYVGCLIARREFERGEALLRSREPSLRTDVLLALIYRAAWRHADLSRLLQRRIAEALDELRGQIGALGKGDRVGWEYPGDWDILKAFLAQAAPDIDTTVFDELEHAVWPDVTAYPDFSAHMAWLSQACGRLSELDSAIPQEDRARFTSYARLLGFPERLQRHFNHDECWLWGQEETEQGEALKKESGGEPGIRTRGTGISRTTP